jgi:signal transduction histidine kinase
MAWRTLSIPKKDWGISYMIKEYLQFRKGIFYLYLSITIIFPLIHFLYRLPMVTIGYSLLLVTFLLTIGTVVDFINYTKKIKWLKVMQHHLTTDKHSLPETKNNMEIEYQQIINSLYEMIQSVVELTEKAHTEQVEYYTMWVHQIKTPISAMRLSLTSDPTNNQSELLGQELFKIEQYVELALQYTKMKDLSTDLIIREYALEDILHQSIKKYAPLFIYKKLSLQIEEFQETITTDSKWLTFIIEQLISNAIKYTNYGGITISYENRVLKISDTGIGIRAEDLERIFEKGYTGYNGRLDKKASGIGLYLVKKVADPLAIKVTITSIVGKGTQATIIFPEADIALNRE